ncbi:hypothetical protein GCM10027456_51230 [Kineosporia babensis]
MHPQVLGGLIGAAGATAFVHVNRGDLPGSWPLAAIVAWAVVLVVFVWASLLRSRHLPVLPPPGPTAGRVYGFSVLGMLVGMAGGNALLNAVGAAELQPAWVVTAVGLHFVPFAAAFQAPVFGRLGWWMTAVGVLGLGFGLIFGETAVAAAAVGAGLLMLIVMIVDAAAQREPS